MAVYDVNGNEIATLYNVNGAEINVAYDAQGNEIDFSESDYNRYDTEYQYAILQARNAWATEYRADENVIPLVLHTDQHGQFLTSKTNTVSLFNYLGLAVKWEEVSVMVGLGDVDIAKTSYPQMNTVLNGACDRTKQINIWGNHDLWENYETVNDQFVVDFDTVYPCFSNETYGDVSVAYNHKGIEYHIDRAHNIKYVTLAGWEIDKTLGGHSHYVIGSDSMESIIDMLEVEDEYDIVLLSHCCPFRNMGNRYLMSEGGTYGSDIIYNEPVSTDGSINEPLVHLLETSLDAMLLARMNHTAGTVNDSYGNSHSYDFTGTSGTIICSLMGHWHLDGYEYSTSGNVLCIDFDAYAYGTHPFYFVNIDRTNSRVHIWKVTDDASVQDYVAALHET